MIPSAEDIAAMRRLRAIMENSEQPKQTTIHQNNNVVPSTGRPDVDAMAEILRRFNKATNTTAERLVEDGRHNPRLQEAMVTDSTDNGLRIGLFEVVAKTKPNNSGNPQKVYDVVNATSNETVCEGLFLMEAAHAIVRYMNKGLSFQDNRIAKILELEETYARNRLDAARFRHRYDRCVQLKEVRAGNVFADRYQVSRANALVAHDQIKSILESIR